MSILEDVQPAREGQHFVWRHKQYTVGVDCGKNFGYWLCITHNATFDSQLEKDYHIEEGVHVLVWMCRYHGPEVP